MAPTDLASMLHRAALLLPHQGPLGSFVHHNTLAALEDQPFHAALERAGSALGAQVRPSEDELRAMLADGRIREEDLRAVFQAEPLAAPEATGPGLPTRGELAWLLLREGIHLEHWRLRAFQVSEGKPDPVVVGLGARRRAVLAEDARRCLATEPDRAIEILAGSTDPETTRRRLREQLGLQGPEDARRRCMDDEQVAEQLGFALLAGLARRGLPPRAAGPPRPDRTELDRRVDEAMLPLVAAFLDQGGLALTARDPGSLYEAGLALLRGRRLLWRCARAWALPTADEALRAGLEHLHPGQPARQEQALEVLLLQRPGWAGAVQGREHDGGAAAPRLLDYAALRLVLILACAADLELDARLVLAPRTAPVAGPGRRADRVAQLLALAGRGPYGLRTLPDAAWSALEQVLEAADEDWRRRLLQEAREAQARRPWLQALRQGGGAEGAASPAVQVLCCIDEREESFRRGLEEHGGATVETLGLAGFFNLAACWQGAQDLQPAPHHPVNLPTTHALRERPTAPPSARRALLGRLWRGLDRGSLGLVGGAVASLLAGPLALAVAAARVLAPSAVEPRLAALAARIAPPPPAVLEARSAGQTLAGLPVGYTAEEAADRIAAALRLVGLDRRLAPTVVVLGHASSNRNNPHAAAYQCGACGGRSGEASARAFAALANDPEVRAALQARGLEVPEHTRFVGGVHDTASDAVRLWAPADLPAPRRDQVQALLDAAAARSALERSRRFLRAPAGATPQQARAHVASRATSLSEPRPEYGHGTNALLVVGPRRRTRGLVLDRRAFLHSYEPEQDPDGALLERLLGAAVPVCAGINLEYYFSRVDNERFGAGTKLPHNLIGLHGVIDGTLGDLRTGLPWQTVEVHEPLRLLVVVLAPRDRVRAVVERLPAVQRLVRGAWIWLSVVEEDRAWRWTEAGFVEEPLPDGELPHTVDSLAWSRGRRDDLAPARVGGAP